MMLTTSAIPERIYAACPIAFFRLCGASDEVLVKAPKLATYEKYLPLFAHLLNDPDDRVRMEAPEIFRVLGKRRPLFVKPYLEQLRMIAENDENRVVRIHCLGAIRAAAPK